MAIDFSNYINTYKGSSVLQQQFPNMNDYLALFGYNQGTTPSAATTSTTTTTPTATAGIPNIINQKDFITIPSAELHCQGKKYIKDGLWHIVANGLPLEFKCADEEETAPHLVQRAIDAGAFVTIAHPEWYSLTFDECLSVSHAHGVEIYNHSCHMATQRGFGIATVDYLLQENNKLFLTATDDSHFKIQDFGGGWVMVAADNLSEISILNALKNGQYYSTTGIEIFEFEMNNSKVNIQCSPSNQVCIVGQGAKSMSQNGKNITNAEFDLTDYPSKWFRVSIADDSGNFAWTNPVWL